MYPCDKCRVFFQDQKSHPYESYFCRKCKTVSNPEIVTDRFPTMLPSKFYFQRRCSPLKELDADLDEAVDNLFKEWNK